MTTTTHKPKSLTLAEILPAVDEMAARISATFRAASREQMDDGASWYATAHHLAVRLDPESPIRAAGVISALSPQMDWERNMFLAERTYSEGLAYGCLGASCRKANTIYNGNGDFADVMDVLNAPKTQAFAATIANPKDKARVVIDRHAVSIALGRPSTDADMTVLNRKGAYDWYASAYRIAAVACDVTPAVMQATTWVVWRETSIRTAASVRAKAGR